MSHDVRPSLNCRTHERKFFTSITPSLHVSLNCRWISIGFMPRKWRNRIITRCSSNVNVAIWVSKTLLQLDFFTSIQRVVQCCHLASPNLKNSQVSSNNFHVSICFHSRGKKIRIPYNLNAPRINKSLTGRPRNHDVIRFWATANSFLPYNSLDRLWRPATLPGHCESCPRGSAKLFPYNNLLLKLKQSGTIALFPYVPCWRAKGKFTFKFSSNTGFIWPKILTCG